MADEVQSLDSSGRNYWKKALRWNSLPPTVGRGRVLVTWEANDFEFFAHGFLENRPERVDGCFGIHFANVSRDFYGAQMVGHYPTASGGFRVKSQFPSSYSALEELGLTANLQYWIPMGRANKLAIYYASNEVSESSLDFEVIDAVSRAGWPSREMWADELKRDLEYNSKNLRASVDPSVKTYLSAEEADECWTLVGNAFSYALNAYVGNEDLHETDAQDRRFLDRHMRDVAGMQGQLDTFHDRIDVLDDAIRVLGRISDSDAGVMWAESPEATDAFRRRTVELLRKALHNYHGAIAEARQKLVEVKTNDVAWVEECALRTRIAHGETVTAVRGKRRY